MVSDVQTVPNLPALAPQNQPAKTGKRSPRFDVIAGLSVIVFALGGFFIWAMVTPLSSAVITPGVVKSDTNRKQIQHLYGGVVEQIHIQNGELVREGDVLITLDETESRAQLDILRARRDADTAALARLAAERDGLDTVVFPSDLTERMGDVEVQRLVQAQNALFDARRASLVGQTAVLEQRIGQLNQEIRGLQAQAESRRIQSQLILSELEDIRSLLVKGWAPRSRVLALEREQARLEGERGAQIASIARLRGQIGEARLQILQVQETFREGVLEEYRATQENLLDIQERLVAGEFRVNETEIRSPEDGYIVDLQLFAPRQVVQPGATLMEIVPADDAFTVEAAIRLEDIDNVAVGQEAEVMFTAFSARTAPRLVGSVTYVSPDATMDPDTRMLRYVARVSVPEEEKARLNGEELRPGMPAQVFINIGERTPMSYLTKPLTGSLSRAWREE